MSVSKEHEPSIASIELLMSSSHPDAIFFLIQLVTIFFLMLKPNTLNSPWYSSFPWIWHWRQLTVALLKHCLKHLTLPHCLHHICICTHICVSTPTSVSIYVSLFIPITTPISVSVITLLDHHFKLILKFHFPSEVSPTVLLKITNPTIPHTLLCFLFRPITCIIIEHTVFLFILVSSIFLHEGRYFVCSFVAQSWASRTAAGHIKGQVFIDEKINKSY